SARMCLSVLAQTVWVEVVLGHLLEPGAVDLAGRVEWHLLEVDDLLGSLVADSIAAEDDQVGTGRSLDFLAQGDVGAHVLAVDDVVTADRARQRHRWMLDERPLHLVWADVGSVMNDHLLLPAEEPEVAVLVGAREVA